MTLDWIAGELNMGAAGSLANVAQLLGVRPNRASKIMLPQDIVTKVREDFSEGDADVIVQLLSELQSEYPTVFCDRILRCIVFCARGRFDEFAYAVKLARLDWRDVIMNAEYDRDWKTHCRDFNLPFAQNVT